MVDAVAKLYDDRIVKKPIGKIIIPSDKTEEMLNKLRQVLWNWNAKKYLNY